MCYLGSCWWTDLVRVQVSNKRFVNLEFISTCTLFHQLNKTTHYVIERARDIAWALSQTMQAL